MEAIFLTWVTDIFFIFTLHILYSKLLGERFQRKWITVLGWGLCFAAWNVNSMLFAESPIIITIGSFLVNFFVLAIVYKGHVRHKIMILFMVLAMGVISEIIIVFILKFFSVDMKSLGLTANYFYYIGNAMSKILWFMFVKVLAVISKNKKQHKIALEEWCEIFLVPLGTILILITMTVYRDYHIILLDMLIISILFTINIATYFIYQRVQEHAKDMIEQESLIHQNEYYKARYEDTEHQWQQLRKIRHV